MSEIRCLDHPPVAEQVFDRTQANLSHLTDLRLRSFAIINRELAQHGVDQVGVNIDSTLARRSRIIGLRALTLSAFPVPGVILLALRLFRLRGCGGS